MNHLHPTNKNLNIYQGTKLNGVELLSGYKFIAEYLQSIEMVMGQALRAYPRLMMIRFDLHYPFMPSCPDYPYPFPDEVISRFFASLMAKYNADLKRRAREGKRVRQDGIHFAWCREQGVAAMPHYHVVLFLSGDAYNALGGKGRPNSNVGRITGAWASALSVGYFDACRLVHIPESRPACYLDVNSLSFEQVYADAFRRISYLAKINTKHYNNSGKSFGCSRKQRG